MKRWKAIVSVVVLLSIVSGAVSGWAQANRSANRGFGVGVLVATVPWPFLTYSFSDRWAVSLSTTYASSILSLGGRVELRLVDTNAVDVLATVGAVTQIGPSGSTTGVLASAILEVSASDRLAIRANADATFSPAGADTRIRASVVYYFRPGR